MTSAVAIPLLAFITAAVLSGVAGRQMLAVWRRLPQAQVVGLDPQAVREALRVALANASVEAHDASRLADIAGSFTRALRDTGRLGRLQDDLRSYGAGLRSTHLGRLQQAAARMLALEQAGEPSAAWWPHVRPYLEGLEHVEFPHFQDALVDVWTQTYRSAGADAGTARWMADIAVGHAHGPFLEYFCDRLQRVADDCEQTGETAGAATCRRIVRHLLRQWVLEPASPGVRLLAADLLAANLKAAGGVDETAEQIAGDLLSWRAAYRDAAGARPATIIGPRGEASLVPAQERRVVSRLVLATWTCGALIVSGLLAAALCWTWLIPKAAPLRPGRALAIALVIAAAMLISAFVWVTSSNAAEEEFRRLLFIDLAGPLRGEADWPVFPTVAAAVTAVLLAIGGVLYGRAGGTLRSRLAGLGLTATATWLLLAVALLGFALSASAARTNYERALAEAKSNPVAAVCGREADRLLDRLRNWQP